MNTTNREYGFDILRVILYLFIIGMSILFFVSFYVQKYYDKLLLKFTKEIN